MLLQKANPDGNDIVGVTMKYWPIRSGWKIVKKLKMKKEVNSMFNLRYKIYEKIKNDWSISKP
jgi:hypothetical protein